MYFDVYPKDKKLPIEEIAIKVKPLGITEEALKLYFNTNYELDSLEKTIMYNNTDIIL